MLMSKNVINDVTMNPPILQLVNTLPFHMPEAWKRYLFWAEPLRIGYYREDANSPPPLPRPRRDRIFLPVRKKNRLD